MRIKRDKTAKAYFDEIIDDFASMKGTESVLISSFVQFNRKRLDMPMFRWNCVFRMQVIH